MTTPPMTTPPMTTPPVLPARRAATTGVTTPPPVEGGHTLQTPDTDDWLFNYKSHDLHSGINKTPLPSNLDPEKLNKIILNMIKYMLYLLSKNYEPADERKYNMKNINHPELIRLKAEFKRELVKSKPPSKEIFEKDLLFKHAAEDISDTLTALHELATEIYQYFFVKQVNGDNYTWSVYEISEVIKVKLNGLYSNFETKNSFKLVLMKDQRSIHSYAIDDFMTKGLSILNRIFKKTCKHNEVITREVVNIMDIHNPRMQDMLKKVIAEKINPDMVKKGQFAQIDKIVHDFFVSTMHKAMKDIERTLVDPGIGEILKLIADFAIDLNTNHLIRISENKRIVVIAKNWEIKVRNVLDLLCKSGLNKIEFVSEQL